MIAHGGFTTGEQAGLVVVGIAALAIAAASIYGLVRLVIWAWKKFSK